MRRPSRVQSGGDSPSETVREAAETPPSTDNPTPDHGGSRVQGVLTRMSVLLILQGPEMGKRFPLGESVILGRAADSGIVLSAKAISRHHARVWQRDGLVFLEDLNSSNGTFL